MRSSYGPCEGRRASRTIPLVRLPARPALQGPRVDFCCTDRRGLSETRASSLSEAPDGPKARLQRAPAPRMGHGKPLLYGPLQGTGPKQGLFSRHPRPPRAAGPKEAFRAARAPDEGLGALPAPRTGARTAPWRVLTPCTGLARSLVRPPSRILTRPLARSCIRPLLRALARPLTRSPVKALWTGPGKAQEHGPGAATVSSGRVFNLCQTQRVAALSRYQTRLREVGFGFGPRPNPRVGGLKRANPANATRGLKGKPEPVAAPASGSARRPLETTPWDGSFRRPFETAPRDDPSRRPLSAAIRNGALRWPLKTAIRDGHSRRCLETAPRDGSSRRPLETVARNGALRWPLGMVPRNDPFRRPFERAPRGGPSRRCL
ncbi:hypothetical protein M885DRAFT_54224 [Pelagophyceae sp. CCMP2097]|nr:hypothetical protein M885DRAFT_54224 [Pelagophyceae sp. CCMP2097]